MEQKGKGDIATETILVQMQTRTEHFKQCFPLDKAALIEGKVRDR